MMGGLEAQDRGFMATALAMASRGIGTTAPNPSVGCVLVKGGVIIGRGWTQPGGRPHAETRALGQAGCLTQGSTAYVTLEPCCHIGQTPPCTDGLINAGVARVVIATADPDNRVDGGGIAALKSAGIEVTVGVLEEQANKVNAGYFKKAHFGLPYVSLKLATTIDGKIAMSSGESKWITGDIARKFGHILRASHDAVVIGSETAINDDPQLTCRISGVENDAAIQPIRVALDRRLRIPANANLVKTANEWPTWIVTSAPANSAKVDKLHEAGVNVLSVADPRDQVFARQAASVLAEKGITRVLVEGGAKVAAAFLHENLVDRIYALQAPAFIGGDGISALFSLEIDQLSDIPRFRRTITRQLGPDLLEILER